MSEPLKISILDRVDTEDFQQLCGLLKEFAVDTYIRNKPENYKVMGDKRIQLVSSAIAEFEGGVELSLLTPKDVQRINEELENLIESAKSRIKDNIEGTKTRYYVLKDGDKMVGFQQAQVSKKNGRIVGWRNLAHTVQEYRKKTGEVLDSHGNLIIEKSYSEALYYDIGEWFRENGVNYEKTCTGVNMLSNISGYIRGKGFFPINKKGKTIFLEKNLSQNIPGSTLFKVSHLYSSNYERTDTKDMNTIMQEIEEIEEFANLTDEQKRGLALCFLKEDEKDIKDINIDMPPEKMELLNRFIAELQNLGMNVDIKDIREILASDDERVIRAKEKVLSSTYETEGASHISEGKKQAVGKNQEGIWLNRLQTQNDIASDMADGAYSQRMFINELIDVLKRRQEQIVQSGDEHSGN